MEDQDGMRFLPLDGQQRLTTLFLLHWYLAWSDDRLADYKAMFLDGRHSRFTYRVRPSSTEFFDSLADFTPTCPPDAVPSLRHLLEDQPWFFLHWRSDPTIQASLTMLDAIHERFKGATGLYARLVDQQHPAITFHLLPLEHFGLSDDLYIKMNARGKPLTQFETFKARFEQDLNTLFPTETRKLDGHEWSVPQFFERRMDTRWTDFFWSHRGKNISLDDAVMNLVWTLIRVSLDPSDKRFATDTTLLADNALVASYTLFNDHQWLSRSLAEHLIELLEAWSTDGSGLTSQLPSTRYFDEARSFRRAITGPTALTYPYLVQFAAFAYYLTQHRGTLEKSNFQEWMRVVSNLVTNSDIERPGEFGRSLAGLKKLLPHSNAILQWLATADVEQLGFSPQQLREESLKAKLILSRPAGENALIAQKHMATSMGKSNFC